MLTGQFEQEGTDPANEQIVKCHFCPNDETRGSALVCFNGVLICAVCSAEIDAIFEGKRWKRTMGYKYKK